MQPQGEEMSLIRPRHRQDPHATPRGGAAARPAPSARHRFPVQWGRGNQIRPLREGDVQGIPALLAHPGELAWVFPGAPYPPDPQWLEAALAGCREVAVCAERGRIVALAALRDPQPGGAAFIEHLVVHPQRRCRGIGSLLLRHLLQQAFHQHRCREAHARVCSDHLPATLFFYEAGFLPYGIDAGADAGAVLRLRLGRRDFEEG
ncbi:GNAT family N-acetyltransferase [Ectothiorhodospira mobilis]|uniref:GNAT family N-acetyltransferase n=1 Tax=Ectothiorhodospira mobilis TaxID=195064 RepID=UPI00190789A5